MLEKRSVLSSKQAYIEKKLLKYAEKRKTNVFSLRNYAQVDEVISGLKFARRRVVQSRESVWKVSLSL